MRVAVIGAGPYGLLYATELAKSGVHVQVFEEHRDVGLPEHCAGLISTETLCSLRAQETVLSEVRGALIYPPSLGKPLVVDAGRKVAVVVDRQALDKLLADRLLSAGGTLVNSARVSEVLRGPGEMFLRVGTRTTKSSIVALATGACKSLPYTLGFERVRGVLPALQADVRGLPHDSQMVEVYLSNRLFPGLFAWLVPRGGVARVGVVGRNALLKLRYLVRKLARLRGARRIEIERLIGGCVVTGGALRKLVVGTALVIGDAAGQTKPTTGGGLAFAAITAKIAAGATIGAMDEGGLSRYEELWWEIFGREVKAMLFLRRLLNSIDDNGLESLVALLRDAGFEEAAVKWGDMDRQAGFIAGMAGSLASHVIKDPSKALTLVSLLARALFRL